MSDLVEKIRDAIDAELARTDWPHRPTCQMLTKPPDGFPFEIFSCNCDTATTWMRMHEAHRKILEVHYRGGHGECDGCNWTAQQDYWTEDVDTCPTLLPIAEAYGITP